MREAIVAGYPVALRLPKSRFRNPRDAIILIGGGALLPVVPGWAAFQVMQRRNLI